MVSGHIMNYEYELYIIREKKVPVKVKAQV